jgi:hypothetical protein
VTVLSTWTLHMIFPLKITLRYFILFTNGVFRPFNCCSSSETLLEKWITRVFSSPTFMFQRSHYDFSAVRPRRKLLRIRRLCFCRVPANRATWVSGVARGGIIVYKLDNVGARTEPWSTLSPLLWTKTICLQPRRNFLSGRKETAYLDLSKILIWIIYIL